MKRLDSKCFALSLGIVCAIGMFILGLGAWIWGWGSALVILVSSLYVGYDATLFGAVVGAVWGFVDGFIGGWLIAWFYNKL